MVLSRPRTRTDEREKTAHEGRSCWFVASCFGENGLRINGENRTRPDTTGVLLLNFWEQAHEASVFNRHGDLTLILRRSAGHGTRGDFAIGRDEALEKLDILVVNVFDVILLEVADFAARMHFLKSHFG